MFGKSLFDKLVHESERRIYTRGSPSDRPSRSNNSNDDSWRKSQVPPDSDHRVVALSIGDDSCVDGGSSDDFEEAVQAIVEDTFDDQLIPRLLKYFPFLTQHLVQPEEMEEVPPSSRKKVKVTNSMCLDS